MAITKQPFVRYTLALTFGWQLLTSSIIFHNTAAYFFSVYFSDVLTFQFMHTMHGELMVWIMLPGYTPRQ